MLYLSYKRTQFSEGPLKSILSRKKKKFIFAKLDAMQVAKNKQVVIISTCSQLPRASKSSKGVKSTRFAFAVGGK